MRIAFVWTNGVRDQARFEHWNDGLRAAMRQIEGDHEVTYHEPDEDLPEVDWILFWEAACTHDSPEWGAAYQKVQNSSQKKALLFAGGPIKKEWLRGFDHVFYESECNGEELRELGIPCSQAFGVNTDIFRPLDVGKQFEVVAHGTCASWKRQWLVGESFGEQALVFGRFQETDPRPFEDCKRFGAMVLPEQGYKSTALLINSAYVALNCADKWGGGQRQTLEAMACDLPVVVMKDSPKNIEYITESGLGVIAEPNIHSIREAVIEAKKQHLQNKGKYHDYVIEKWSHSHYAAAIIKALYGSDT